MQAVNIQGGAQQAHFAHDDGHNFTKMFYILLLGSFVGYLVETTYCGIISSRYVYRGSLLYGPVNLIYGIGALSLYICLRKVDRDDKLKVLLIGALCGTAVEYLCSLFQELAFGTVSWDYSHIPLNIGGRVNLLYSIFWGALALMWVYLLYPGLEKLLGKIPNIGGRRFAVILCLWLTIDIMLSVVAVARWTDRQSGLPAASRSDEIIDVVYPDSRMEEVYSSMMLVER